MPLRFCLVTLSPFAGPHGDPGTEGRQKRQKKEDRETTEEGRQRNDRRKTERMPGAPQANNIFEVSRGDITPLLPIVSPHGAPQAKNIFLRYR